MNLSLLENIGQILLCLVVKSANDLMCIGRCKIDLMPIGPMHALIWSKLHTNLCEKS
jgi:hypothetical protein